MFLAGCSICQLLYLSVSGQTKEDDWSGGGLGLPPLYQQAVRSNSYGSYLPASGIRLYQLAVRSNSYDRKLLNAATVLKCIWSDKGRGLERRGIGLPPPYQQAVRSNSHSSYLPAIGIRLYQLAVWSNSYHRRLSNAATVADQKKWDVWVCIPSDRSATEPKWSFCLLLVKRRNGQCCQTAVVLNDYSTSL